MASGMANKHEFEMDNPEQMELVSEEGRDHGKAIRSLKHRLAKTGIGQLIRRPQTVEFENRLFLMSGPEQPSSGDGSDPRCQPRHADRASQALELG
jgi:hypothetical protein